MIKINSKPLKVRITGAALLFCLIFAGAFYLRQFTFWLPHWQGDQSQYIMLAMKLRSAGGISFADYNLRGINTEVLKIDSPRGTEAIYPYRIEGDGKGFVLNAYERVGLGFLDVPFFYRPPMLPIALAVSHALLAPKDQPFAVIKNNLGAKVLDIQPGLYLRTQAWAAIIPFASSLLVLLMIYLWSRRAFGEGTALAASFIFATNPVSILTANRVWTEDLATLFMTLAMFGYRHGIRRGRVWVCLAAGVAAGLAVLTNPKALLAVAALGLYTWFVLQAEHAKRSAGTSSKFFPGAFLKIWTCVPWWAFLSGSVVTTAGWFMTIHQRYGNPLWQPEPFNRMIRGREIALIDGIGANLQGWYDALLSQPHGAIYYSVGTAAICWAFAAGYMTLRDAWGSTREAFMGRAWDDRPLFLWCWILAFAVFFMTHRTGEYRYLFFVYPALAILSGWMCVKIGDLLSGFTARRWIATAAVCVFLILSANHSVRLVLPVLWDQKNLITAPWY